jgi:DNA-binding phage protein
MSRDREVFELLRAIVDMKASTVARKSGVAASTIAKWRKPLKEGGTRHPQFHTMQKVARAVGMRFQLMPAGASKREEDRPHVN